MREFTIIMAIVLLLGLKILNQNINYGRSYPVDIRGCGFMISGYAKLVGVMRSLFGQLSRDMKKYHKGGDRG